MTYLPLSDILSNHPSGWPITMETLSVICTLLLFLYYCFISPFFCSIRLLEFLSLFLYVLLFAFIYMTTVTSTICCVHENFPRLCLCPKLLEQHFSTLTLQRFRKFKWDSLWNNSAPVYSLSEDKETDCEQIFSSVSNGSSGHWLSVGCCGQLLWGIFFSRIDRSYAPLSN